MVRSDPGVKGITEDLTLPFFERRKTRRLDSCVVECPVDVSTTFCLFTLLLRPSLFLYSFPFPTF